MDKVIVIGNAPITNRGELINLYDVVIRINHLYFRQQAKNCGTKIDIWAMRYPKRFPVMGWIHKFKIREMWIFNNTNYCNEVIFL